MLGHIKPSSRAAASYFNVGEDASFELILAAVRADIADGNLAPHRCMDELKDRLFAHARETRRNDLRRCLDDPEWGRMMLEILDQAC